MGTIDLYYTGLAGKWANFGEELSFRADQINQQNSFLLIDFPEQVHVYKVLLIIFKLCTFVANQLPLKKKKRHIRLFQEKLQNLPEKHFPKA